jgi:transcription elongation factor GreA
VSEPIWLSQSAYDRLSRELEELQNEARPRISKEIEEARAHGDISENAEYDAAKEEQAKLEGRIRELSDTLSRAEVGAAPFSDRAGPGSVVTVLDSENQQRTFLLGSREDRPEGMSVVSTESPLGKALTDREAGEVVTYTAPGGSFEVRITDIRPLES